MAKNVREVKVVLTKDRKINGKDRKAGFVLMIGTLSSGITAKDVDLAIARNTASAVAKPEKIEEGS